MADEATQRASRLEKALGEAAWVMWRKKLANFAEKNHQTRFFVSFSSMEKEKISF
ncbi:MAG: hypothetical protein PHW92_12730 [Lutibacter sp.]|nr:hypothetical protein [Lutibacter sp.]